MEISYLLPPAREVRGVREVRAAYISTSIFHSFSSDIERIARAKI